MGKINYVIIGLFLMLSQVSMGQLKITQQGFVGVGTNTPWERLHVDNGSAIISNNGRSLRLWPWLGVYIGSNYGTVGFWEKDSKWNHVEAGSYHTVSEESLKDNITTIKNPLNVIKNLRGVHYRLKNEGVILPDDAPANDNEYTFGFIAQEVEKIIPEIVFESMNLKSIN